MFQKNPPADFQSSAPFNKGAIIFISFFIFSCDSNIDKEKEKKEFLSKFNNMLAQIANFSLDDLNKKFLIEQIGDKNNNKIYLLGETYIDKEGILANWGFLNHLACKEKINILMEGGEREKEKTNESWRKFHKLLVLYFHNQLIEENVPFDPHSYDVLTADRIKYFWENILISIDAKEIKTDGLCLKKMNFDYWDAPYEIKKQTLSFDQTFRRNEFMIKAIKDTLEEDKTSPLVIMAGFSHLPLGDYYQYAKKYKTAFNIPPDYENYYELVKNKREENLILKDDLFGNSQVIFEGLKGKNYLQLIPKTSLALWEKMNKI